MISFAKAREGREIKKFAELTEGTHIFKIIEVDESKIEFDKVSIKMENKDGARFYQNFDISSVPALTSLEMLSMRALGVKEVEENFDLQTLVGHYLQIEVEPREYNGKTYWQKKKGTYFGTATGFEGVEDEPVEIVEENAVEDVDDDPTEW